MVGLERRQSEIGPPSRANAAEGLTRRTALTGRTGCPPLYREPCYDHARIACREAHMSKRTQLETTAPGLPDATIARVRAMAHRYVRAGGGVFTSPIHDDRDQHIANARHALTPRDTDDGFSQAIRSVTSTLEEHERVWNAGMAMCVADTDAAFLFGAMVGLEVAALTVGQVSVPTKGRRTRGRKGGAR